MHRISNSHLRRIICFILLLTLIIPVDVYATTENVVTPRASDYLSSYNTYLYNAAWGKIRVYFDVTGVNYMDEIGALSVQVYESSDNVNWTWVKTYTHDATTGMLGYNKIYHSNYVEYAGTIGRYYKAYVCLWAGKNGDGDTRYYWSDVKKATLLPG